MINYMQDKAVVRMWYVLELSGA